jgi:hypothetical protein
MSEQRADPVRIARKRRKLVVVGQFAGEPSFNHEGHKGTRRNTFAIKDLRETSGPSWLMPLQFNI